MRDLATHYISIAAYLFYNYCDQNSGRLLPYIKVTYQGNLSLQQDAYWSGRNQGDPRKHAEMSTGERGVSFECTRVKKCEQSRAGKMCRVKSESTGCSIQFGQGTARIIVGRCSNTGSIGSLRARAMSPRKSHRVRRYINVCIIDHARIGIRIESPQ